MVNEQRTLIPQLQPQPLSPGFAIWLILALSLTLWYALYLIFNPFFN